MNEKDITVIMPALDEEKNIGQAIDNTLCAFRDYKLNGELIVVNDGSRDRTPDIVEERIAKELSYSITLLHHDKPRGIGASFWDGVARAQGNIVTMFPGDNENDPWEILRYYKLLEHLDIVIPFIFNRETRPIFRNALSFAYRFIINTTFFVNFNYTNGTVMYRKSILNELEVKSDGFFFQTDILIRSVKKRYLFAEVPYKLGVRESGTSKAISFPSLWQVIKGYIRLVYDFYRKNRKPDDSFSRDSVTAIRRDDSHDSHHSH